MLRLGSFDIRSGRIDLYKIPTNNSGIMGIVLSPDNNSIWFAEIIGNKIGSIDINSKRITEYPTGDLTGPTLLSFDIQLDVVRQMLYLVLVTSLMPVLVNVIVPFIVSGWYSQ